MSKKVINIIFITILILASTYIYSFYPNVWLFQFIQSLSIFLIAYLVFAVFINGFIVKKLKVSRNRYSFRKIIDIIFYTVFLTSLVMIWIDDPQALVVSYGLIGAGVAVALQDLFKDFVGGFLIITNNLYKIGDRIDINGKMGDVIDIGILYTTIFEIGEWIHGDQPTGRITKIANQAALNGTINNYTQDHSFIWDEIFIPVTYESDWQKAITEVRGIAMKQTLTIRKNAEKEIKSLKEKYYFADKGLKPEVYVKLTDNWITLRVRYLTDVKTRRVMHDLMSRKILEALQNMPKVEVASTTLVVDINAIPDIKFKK